MVKASGPGYASCMQADRPNSEPREWDDANEECDDLTSTGRNSAVADMSDSEFDDWMESLPPCPDLPSTPEEIAAADARARADIAAGRVYPHSVVAAWLKTWGDPDCKPFKEWLKSSG